MRRHNPTLYTHPEQEDHRNGEDPSALRWDSASQRPYGPSPVPGPSSASSSRSSGLLTRHPNSFMQSSQPSNSLNPTNSDIYKQFVRRYRGGTGDPRNDPEVYYYQGRDSGDLSDDEDGNQRGNDVAERMPNGIEVEQPRAPSEQESERLEWQTMLASVLAGEVLKSEKTRIAVALESQGDEQQNAHLNIWLGIRARFHARSVEEERRRLEEKRIRTVDPIIEDILKFRVAGSEINTDRTTQALKEVNALLRRLEVAQSLYPNLKAFYLDKPIASEAQFQARCDTLNTWSTLMSTLRHQLSVLRRWTGSDTLDVTQPNTSSEVPIGASLHPNSTKGSPTPTMDGSSFVERLLKEETMQRIFEKGFLVTVHAFIDSVRKAQVKLAKHFKEMNLPAFENDLVPLISFPTKLAQASLRYRLDYVEKLNDPDILIIDQMTDDLKISIGLACTLKRQYEAFLNPDPSSSWSIPNCISEDYDATILEALSAFFKLMHWKLKSGSRAIYFKETDILEAQWATFNDVSLSTGGGSRLVAEQICSLTNKLMVRVINYFDTQIRLPTSATLVDEQEKEKETRRERMKNRGLIDEFSDFTGSGKKMTRDQLIGWYGKVLDIVRLRYRKLSRFARVLTQRFSNSAEYSLDDVPLDRFIDTLVATDHFLVYTQAMEEEGYYVVASGSLFDRPEVIKRILSEAFQVDEVTNTDGIRVAESAGYIGQEFDDARYLLILTPECQFLWTGRVMVIPTSFSLDVKESRVRLIADGPQRRLNLAKKAFDELFSSDPEGEDELSDFLVSPLTCVVDFQAHLPAVNRELRKIARATGRLAESIVESVHPVRDSLRMVTGYQELLENWYMFASEHGQHAQRHMERASLYKFNRLMIKLAISWVSFICDDCDPTDRKTFKWAVHALEFTLIRTKRNILQLPEDQFNMLRQKVASCMTLLISHFDILGARGTLEARREKEKQEERLKRQYPTQPDEEDEFSGSLVSEHDDAFAFTDSATRLYWDRLLTSIRELDEVRQARGAQHRILGKVLDDEKPEDRSLVFLASSSSNISIRWQQGKFIGAGTFGSVYLAVNLDSGSLMAVKEIKFQELSGLPNLYAQIKDELSVMELLHHPNVVEYYGIEVHRDKVYIFEEYCQGGSLATLLEHGRIEDECIIQVYTLQMLEGLAYLHSKNVVHRDIKPDNILLDHHGVIKFVDFGAAKILAKNHRTFQRSRRAAGDYGYNGNYSMNALPAMSNGLTGTPMYMSPEVIKNDKRGRHGAMDIWSLGCVVLEFATGKKPWSNLDNEWAIMFHIGVATQHPPLPEPDQLSPLGIDFIRQCLTIDPMLRPTAKALMDHPWLAELKYGYEEPDTLTSPPLHMPNINGFENATVARTAAIIQEKEIEAITAVSPVTPTSEIILDFSDT
ncbi:hypothetical protein D9756_004047 [Leucocoprinus leucothites]|uniref:Protein kinase domain-containing protein n=1 Tax=Leucocoprinus leucothites TaxID=201217 RepID=A0A8H5D915_9AGAR|nr:hypothetical protein D9756_004047 [Leucoagaricus leucothites]